jgi:putative membrane-bound dehydrogenase-like protein
MRKAISVRAVVLVLAVKLFALGGTRADDESLVFTPPGFEKPGAPATDPGENPSRLEISINDASTGRPTACRVNVVGPDGRFYQPAENSLTPYSLTGEWPKTGKGNRVGKAPIRYFGRFFYTAGNVTVAVPAGRVRIEAWKGLEYAPGSLTFQTKSGATHKVSLALEHAVDMSALGYDSGDLHLHLRRENEADDQTIFNLLEAENIRYGTPLMYNEPAGPYTGVREKLDYRQLVGLGAKSERRRGAYRILSGQEYRSTTYGHLNLFLRDDLVREGESYSADNWPAYGLVGRETIAKGGYAIHAHGGYAQSIYADFVQREITAVELLQFGVYRGIGLDDWYRILNIGYRFPCVGASDYPACRKLGDCVTYVRHDKSGPADFAVWLRCAAEGRSFVTTAPLLLLEVNGDQPGAVIKKSGRGPHTLTTRVRVASPIATVSHLQWIVNGRVLRETSVPAGAGRNEWFTADLPMEISDSSWIAARAFGEAVTGSPDAEAHTNPVYIHVNGKAPFDRSSLDHLLEKLDGQMAVHRARKFAEKAKILDYFQKSRDILLKIREAGGLPSEGVPKDWLDVAEADRIDPTARTLSDAELAAFLKPMPARSPQEALKTFETTGGLRMELVASEPFVHSPVAAAFDENGNLYVAEMTDYPYKPKPGHKPLGAVRLLRDTDGDGRFDESHVFADGLLWAAGIAPWKGGVFVASPPDIWYLKDTDGDFKADVRRKVYTGFGTDNEQGMLNNLTFGLDHKVYGSSSVNGGTVRPATDPKAEGVSVKGRDFRFDPVTEAFEPITGAVQFGNTFDDFGNRFLCSESRPLMHVVLPLAAMARNPYLPVPTGLENVAGSPVPIFRLSPLERWRQIRSSRRIAHSERSADSAGASHHVIDAAAGVTICRGTAYGADLYGNAFVCDAQNNLIHRMRLVPDGASFRAERADEKTEVVRSYDNWFRPVNLVNAPDGSLYVLDMSREIIEAIHIPSDVVKHLDLRRGRNQGRIYRLAPPGFKAPPRSRLGAAGTLALVAELESSNGWNRDTAHRLLFEHQDKAAVRPLRDLLARGSTPMARVHALWSLHGLNALSEADLLAGLMDPSPHVIEQALRLSEERFDTSPKILARILELADAPQRRTRFAVALSLGATADARAVPALVAIARRAENDRWSRLAVLCASADRADRLLDAMLDDRAFATSKEGGTYLEALAEVAGARNRASEIERVLSAIADLPDAALARRLVLALGRGLQRPGRRIEMPAPGAARSGLLARLFDQATRDLKESAPEANRLEAVALIGCAPFETARSTLFDLLSPRYPAALQVAALRALASYPNPEIADPILKGCAQLSPAAQSEAVETLLAREPWTLALLKAVRAGTADPAAIDPTRRALLMAHPDPEIAALAQEAFRAASSTANRGLDSLKADALNLRGDPARGNAVFEQHCVTCHRIGERGHAVGPDLTATQFGDADALLTQVIDPNRYVAPNYVQYVVADKSGRIFTGLVASETASSLTLRRAEGAEDTLLRSQIEELKSTGKSLMPEDFATKLTRQDAADLVAFLLKARTGHPVEDRLEMGTLPGLIEPDGN